VFADDSFTNYFPTCLYYFFSLNCERFNPSILEERKKKRENIFTIKIILKRVRGKKDKINCIYNSVNLDNERTSGAINFLSLSFSITSIVDLSQLLIIAIIITISFTSYDNDVGGSF
jgi:hypothetical protein